MKTWVDLSLFAKVVLAKPSRGGRKHWKRNIASLKERCRRVMDGEIRLIFNELLRSAHATEIKSQSTAQSKPKEDHFVDNEIVSKQTIKKMKWLISHGKTRKAVMKLKTNGIADLSVDDNMAKLQKKYPVGTAVEKKPISQSMITKKLNPDDTDCVISHLDITTAPGLTGLSNGHISALWKQRSGTRLERAFEQLHLCIINGKIHHILT
eukprot:578804_1